MPQVPRVLREDSTRFRAGGEPLPGRRRARGSCISSQASHLVAMARALPPDAETVMLPHVGTVIVFCDGKVWRAVRPDYDEHSSSPSGLGETPGEAIAELVAQEP